MLSELPGELPGPNSLSMVSSNDGLKCRFETAFDGLECVRTCWDEAVIRLGGNIYMSYDWVRTWWELYGAGKELHIFLFTLADKVVGILPLYIDSFGWGPLRFRVARLIGANIPPKVFDPAIEETFAERIFEAVLVQLFQEDKCDLLSLGPVSELHKPTAQLPGICRFRSDLVAQCRTKTEGVHSVFWLPPTMDKYFEGLSKSERKKRKYEFRLLRKESDVKVDVLKDPRALDGEFGRFATQHTAQWEVEGKAGHFGAWPRGLEFNQALVKAHGPLDRVRFVRIIANGKVVSNQYVFAFGDSWYWELPARAMGPQWERLSLGPAGLITTVEAAIQEGKRRLDGGIGHYEYKVKLGAKEHQLFRIHILANRVGSRFRMALFNALRCVLLYGYHKIWYQRIQPRLPAALRKPQWWLWLRLDF
jgi:CelD/BcsL family acetyltransferase involved in cellulose biosynthesis